MSALRRAWPAVLLFLGAGCKDSYSSAMEERVKAQEELVGILEGIKDQAGMDVAFQTLSDNYKRLREANERMLKMHPPTSQAKEALAKEYGPRLQTAVQAIMREVRRIKGMPGGDAFFERLDKLAPKQINPGIAP